MDDTDSIDPRGGPFALFSRWFGEAVASEPRDPNAMTVATATAGGAPSARMVLLKSWNEEGFVFYTNSMSRKGREIAENPRAHLLFYWKSLSRQVRIDATLSTVTDAEADAYFASRPHGARVGAWASEQSAPLASRPMLEARLRETEARFEDGDVPRPPHWQGYRARPLAFEFWQERLFRLHERLVFRQVADGWADGLLYP